MRFKVGGVEMDGSNDGPIVVSGFDSGSAAVRENDTDRPSGDGVIVGRDFIGAKTWAFDLSVRGHNIGEVLAAEAPLSAVWLDPKIRQQPQKTISISYEIGGRWRRVYGRPGAYAGTNGDFQAELGFGFVTCNFRVTDYRHFDDVESSVRLSIVPGSTGGLLAPLMAPLSTVGGGPPRAGRIRNDGDSPTPLRVVFKGPVINPWIRAATGWELALGVSLAWDEVVEVDAREGTILRNGVPAAGLLKPSTRLSAAVLPPGDSDITFGGVDLTGTASVTLAWRSAHSSI